MTNAIKALLVTVLALAPAAGVHAAPEPPAKPNVLFIIVDDLRPDFGCYGNTEVKSPNLDRLAGEGLLFQRAYCQFPLCMPSRSSVLSGYRPESIKKTGRVSGHVPAGTITLPQLFRNHGYVTVSAGKVYHDNDDDPAGWVRRYTDTFDSEGKWCNGYCSGYQLEKNRALVQNYLQGKRRQGLPASDHHRDHRHAGRENPRWHHRPAGRRGVAEIQGDRRTVLPRRRVLPSAHAVDGAEEILGHVRPRPDQAAGRFPPARRWHSAQRLGRSSPLWRLPLEGADAGRKGQGDHPWLPCQHHLRGCSSRQGARRTPPSGAGREHGRRPLERQRLEPGRARSLQQVHQLRNLDAHHHDVQGPVAAPPARKPGAGRAGGHLSDARRTLPLAAPGYLEGTSVVPLLTDPGRPWKTGGLQLPPQTHASGPSATTATG